MTEETDLCFILQLAKKRRTWCFKGKTHIPAHLLPPAPVMLLVVSKGGGAGGRKSAVKFLLSLVSLLVEIAAYEIFPENTGLVMAEFTLVVFGMMRVLMLAKWSMLMIWGRRGKILFIVCISASEFLVVCRCSW